MPAWTTVGFQWFCCDCDAGSHGGIDGSRPTIKAEMERAARTHCLDYGHETQVDRMQMVRFDRDPRRIKVKE